MVSLLYLLLSTVFLVVLVLLVSLLSSTYSGSFYVSLSLWLSSVVVSSLLSLLELVSLFNSSIIIRFIEAWGGGGRN